MSGKITEERLQQELAKLPGWEREGDEIRKTFTFPDFAGAMEFVNRVADEAQAADHHPDIDIRYNKVTLALSTHSAGGLTGKDTHLAHQIEAAVKPNL